MPKRRRKQRHIANPLRYLTPELVKAIALCAVAAVPSIAVSRKSGEQVEAAETKVEYANANTNAALAALTALTYRVDSLRAEVAALKRRSPQDMIGPTVPHDWLPQPMKRKKWFGIF